MNLTEDFWTGILVAVLLIGVVGVLIFLFTVGRPRILPYEAERKDCVVYSNRIERCYLMEAE